MRHKSLIVSGSSVAPVILEKRCLIIVKGKVTHAFKFKSPK